MAVTVVQQPQLYDMAYGPNFVTLNTIGSAQKFAVRVLDSQTSEQLALVTQTPNQEGRAQFDLQQIFQQHVHVSSTGIETLGLAPANVLDDSALESTKFTIEVGTVTGNVFTADQSLTPKVILNGVKPYNQIPYRYLTDTAPADVVGNDSNPPCTIVNTYGKMLTDRPRNQYPSGVLPPSVSINIDYVAVKLTRSDSYTISYMNDLNQGTPAPNVLTNGIEAFEICEVDANNTVINRTYIPNVTGNGGGPNATYNAGTAMQYPFVYLTMGVGPLNLDGMSYKNTSGANATFNFNQNTKRYWIVPRAYTPPQCSQQSLSQTTHEPLLVIFDEDTNCLEYPTSQISWLNRWGFRDYFEFKLRQEVSQKQKSNTYLKTWNDYNSTTAGHGSGAGSGILEGGTTVFNKFLDTALRLNTAYLSDEDAYYLNGLFKSSNVRMRTDGDFVAQFTDWPYEGNQWFPVVITNGSYVEKTYRKNRLFQFEMQANLAHNPQIQRGS